MMKLKSCICICLPRPLFLSIILGVILSPSITFAGGEAAEVNQMFQACINSGGRAASNYNDWVAQNGCICPGSSTGSGQRTCSGSSSSSSTPDSSGNLVTDSTRNVVQGVMNGNQQQMGVGMMGIGAAALIQGMQGNPEDEARQQAAAAERARQAQLENEQAEQRAEESKKRLLGELLDADSQVDKPVANQDTVADNQPTLAGLPLMTDDVSASAPVLPTKQATDSLPQGKAKTDAFKKGFHDASQCFSSSAGTYCNNVTSEQLQSCVADYNGGFNTGNKHLALIMGEAFDAGKEDGKSGELANGPADPRAEGPCRTSWIEAYNRGYFQGKQAK